MSSFLPAPPFLFLSLFFRPYFLTSLRDSVPAVRKTAVMVLTRLILNDMIKVKGQISELSLRLEDPEQAIADLAHLFFFELAQKGNAIYNLLPDIISQVAEPTSGADSQQFRSIMTYLFSFIQKVGGRPEKITFN